MHRQSCFHRNCTANSDHLSTKTTFICTRGWSFWRGFTVLVMLLHHQVACRGVWREKPECNIVTITRVTVALVGTPVGCLQAYNDRLKCCSVKSLASNFGSFKEDVRTINDRNICERRSCMKNNGKSPTFKFVSGEERRPSEVRRVSRGWRLPGATHSSADLTWIRK